MGCCSLMPRTMTGLSGAEVLALLAPAGHPPKVAARSSAACVIHDKQTKHAQFAWVCMPCSLQEGPQQLTAKEVAE